MIFSYILPMESHIFSYHFPMMDFPPEINPLEPDWKHLGKGSHQVGQVAGRELLGFAGGMRCFFWLKDIIDMDIYIYL